jgi:pimeloyl-ACP methyl ester carboxylesterase
MREDHEDYARLANGIELCFDTFGEQADPAMLLIMGLGGPLIWWAPDLCRMLADRGFFVIRYDNRDVGKSTKLSSLGGSRTAIVKALLRGAPPPYTLSDMGGDGIGLLDHLRIERAHIVGVSMGGMIAQTLTLEHPTRVLSLVSIMSTTGRRSVGWQDPRLLPQLLGSRRSTREDFLDRSVRTWSAIGSPAYPMSPDETRARAAETYDRGIDPAGVLRQTHAVLAQPDRSSALRNLTVPTLVVHGTRDRMVHVSGGKATAAAIPNAELLLVPGMGHDLPRDLWPVLVEAIERTARRAEVESAR